MSGRRELPECRAFVASSLQPADAGRSFLRQLSGGIVRGGRPAYLHSARCWAYRHTRGLPVVSTSAAEEAHCHCPEEAVANCDPTENLHPAEEEADRSSEWAGRRRERPRHNHHRRSHHRHNRHSIRRSRHKRHSHRRSRHIHDSGRCHSSRHRSHGCSCSRHTRRNHGSGVDSRHRRRRQRSVGRRGPQVLA